MKFSFGIFPAASAIALLLFSGNARALTYPIDPLHGDDAAPAGKPWRTFGRLTKATLQPGDTVIIAPGRQEETLRPIGSGTPEKPITLRFLPGVHTIGTQSLTRLPMFISNSMDTTAPKAVGIVFQQVKNYVIEGAGAGKSTILYDGRMVQIFNDRSENLRFSGLTFDLKRPTVSEFRVCESTPSQAVIEIADGSDHAIENGRFLWKGDWGPGGSCVEADLEKGTCHRTKAPRGWTGSGQIEATATDLGDRKVRLDFPSEGTGLTAGHQYQFRGTMREFVGVHSSRCKNVVFRDCDFHALVGMGFVSQFTENITFQRVNVRPPEGSLRTCAAWADIFHFSNCGGTVTVDSCKLSGMQDDALNCHGTHLRITGRPAENQLALRFMHPQTYGFAPYQPGDVIAVTDHKLLREYDGNPRRKVTAVERISDKEWTLTLDGPAPRFEKDDVVDNVTWHPDLIATNNQISMDPVRGFLITTRGKALVENNTFLRTAMPGILIENDASGWFESGPVGDLLIRHNRFVACGISITPHISGGKPDDWVHQNIRIQQNQFDEGGKISAANVKDLSVIGNTTPGGTPVPLDTNSCPGLKTTP